MNAIKRHERTEDTVRTLFKLRGRDGSALRAQLSVNDLAKMLKRTYYEHIGKSVRT